MGGNRTGDKIPKHKSPGNSKIAKAALCTQGQEVGLGA